MERQLPEAARGTVLALGMKRWLVLLATVLAAAACGTTSDGLPTEAVSAGLACETSPDEILSLLTEGLPTHDYEPAEDLADLIAKVDLVLTGTLASAQRVENPSNLEATTRVEVAEFEVLYSSDTRVESNFADDPVLRTDAIWALTEPDPLRERVQFDPARTRFVAFLHYDEDGQFRIDVQGLHVGCTTGQIAAVMEPLPPGFSGESADDLASAVEAIVNPVVPRNETNFDSIPYRLIAEDLAAGAKPGSTNPASKQNPEPSGNQALTGSATESSSLVWSSGELLLAVFDVVLSMPLLTHFSSGIATTTGTQVSVAASSGAKSVEPTHAGAPQHSNGLDILRFAGDLAARPGPQ